MSRPEYQNLRLSSELLDHVRAIGAELRIDPQERGRVSRIIAFALRQTRLGLAEGNGVAGDDPLRYLRTLAVPVILNELPDRTKQLLFLRGLLRDAIRMIDIELK